MEQAIQFKFMKSNKEAGSIVANVAEMVLQTRIAPPEQHLHRVQTVRSEIEVLRSHLHPSDEVLYFLVDRQCYQIRNKVMAHQRKTLSAVFALTITFTVFDKQLCSTEIAQIWKLEVNRKPVQSLRAGQCSKQLINAVREVTLQLTASYNFSQLTRNKEANKKYVIDFKVDLNVPAKHTDKSYLTEYSMRQWRARLNESLQAQIGCFWRENTKFAPLLVSAYAGTKMRKTSQQTRGDSCCFGSQKEMGAKKYRSMDEQQQAYEFYDTQLDVTIISSDSDSLSHSRKAINELVVGEVDEFQLLIEDNIDEDELFVIQNEVNFQNWQKLLLLNFH